MDCSVSQKIQFESKLARDNSIAKEARELSKNDFQFFGNNDCYNKVDPATNIYKFRITFNPMYCTCSWFLDVGNCRHYVAACLLSDREKTDEEKMFIVVNVKVKNN